MSQSDHIASDESQRDPAAATNDAPIVNANHREGNKPDTDAPDTRSKNGTGPHSRVRSTGTDKKPIESVAEGVEDNTQRLKKKEPDDNLPDQLDRYK